MRVFVYFNLHKKVWSVKALNGPNKGRVIAHLKEVGIVDASFRVSKAGRERVLRERRKNVHAGVVGYLAPVFKNESEAKSVRYNPYLKGEFFDATTEQSVFKASTVVLDADRRVWAW